MTSGITFAKADFNAYLQQYTVHKVLHDNNRFNLGSKSIRLAIIDDINSCYFIYINGAYAGGSIMDKGKIKHPFLLPGYQIYLKDIIQILHKKAAEKADFKKGIVCLPSDSGQAEIFLMLGYETVRKMRCMIGPLNNFIWNAPDGYLLKQPSESDLKLIAKLFYKANINDPWHQPVTEEGFLRGAVRYFDDNQVDRVLETSTLCFDIKTGEPVGGCLISIDEAYPFVYDLHVLKEHRRKGIASAMMKKAMSIMSVQHKFMRLFVIDGNPAGNLYDKLGFITGNPVYIMNYKLG